MSRSLILSIVFIIALTFMVSCSGGDGNLMTTPAPTDRDTVVTPTPGTTACFGLWQIVIDPATGTGDIVQLRNADKILNVLGFMEPPPLSLMDLDWPALVIDDPVIKVGVILTHPIGGDPVFTGFDVRGVCFGPEVTNADGLTIIPSPEYFSGVPFGYQDGLLGAPDSTSNYEGLAGYKYYCDGLDADEDLAAFMSNTDNLDDRGSFGDGETNQRDYILDWTDSDHGFFVFNYAIYANYEWPVGDPPITLDSFEITTANSAEAFCASITEVSNSLWFAGTSGGGTINLDVEVWDWQGDISEVSVEAPGVMTEFILGTSTAGSTAYSHVYSFIDVPAVPITSGELDIIITATDGATFGEVWFLGLLEPGHALYDAQVYNAFLYTTTVSEAYIDLLTPNGAEEWYVGANEDITWDSGGVGYVDIEYSKDNFVSDVNPIAMDEVNLDTFSWAIPGDLSTTVRVRVSSTVSPSLNDVSEADFSILDTGWARTWGSTAEDISACVCVDPNSGYIYVGGRFTGTVDFDNGPGVDSHTSVGERDAFLCKYDAYGSLQWARTWGGVDGPNPLNGFDCVYDIDVDASGNVYATGYYGSVNADFDPGNGTAIHSANWYDAWTSKFDSDGIFQWVNVWGGSYSDTSYGIVVDDANSCYYIVGAFRGNTDFDPSSGTYYRSSYYTSFYHGYISQFDLNGNHMWAGTWGDNYIRHTVCNDADIDSSGSVYVAGYFEGSSFDFDPGGGTWNMSSNNSGYYDAFLSKFNSSQVFQWALRWGGGTYADDVAYDVAVDGSDGIWVTGRFFERYSPYNVDFDPGVGTYNLTCNGWYDSYLTKFNTAGVHQWAGRWGGNVAYGGSTYDMSNDIFATNSNVYVSGRFSSTNVDFDPGAGTDLHDSAGGYDAALSVFDLSGAHQWTRTYGSTGNDYGDGVGANPTTGDVFYNGFFTGVVDFDPGTGTYNRTSEGGWDAFLTRLFSDGYW